MNDLLKKLAQATQARINLGHKGTGMPTRAFLNFSYDHALAQDAVYCCLDSNKLQQALQHAGFEVLRICSKASNRHVYLKFPNLGREIDPAYKNLVHEENPVDLVFCIADGLSARAVHEHALPFLEEAMPLLAGLSVGKIILAEQGRVALSDEIGERTKAQICVMLIGERPGLSSPDSMGLYLTYGPRVGNTDEKRNCISNIRRQGLSYKLAAHKLNYLVRESLRRKLSGVGLKDEMDTNGLES